MLIRYLFYLIGIVWFGLAVATFIGGGWLLGMLMVGNGAVLAAVGFGLNERPKLFYWLGLAVLAVNILLTFTDQFGFWDLATLLIDLVVFSLLISERKHYLLR